MQRAAGVGSALLAAALDAEGVDVSHVGVRPLPTALYLREWLPDGERRPYYYRSGSASPSFTPADWPEEIEGAAWLNLTGITPALSQSSREATLAASSKELRAHRRGAMATSRTSRPLPPSPPIR